MHITLMEVFKHTEWRQNIKKKKPAKGFKKNKKDSYGEKMLCFSLVPGEQRLRLRGNG